MLYQIAFDFYDTNNDDRISELDLFKVMQQFSKDFSTDVKIPEDKSKEPNSSLTAQNEVKK